MSSQDLQVVLIYFAVCTVLGGLAMSWRFVQLRRDALAGAFSGFGAALLGLGLPGLMFLWGGVRPKQLGLMDEVGELDPARKGSFRFERNVLWGMGAFALMWLSLIVLAADTSPSRFLVVVANGMYEGMLIFLVAAGLSIIFGLMDVLNLAQGAFFMVGAYIAWEIFGELDSWRATTLGLGAAFAIALLLAALAGALIGFLVERLLIRPTYSRPFFQIVLTFGLALAITELVKARYGTQGVANLQLGFLDGGSTILMGLFPGTSIQNYWIFMIASGLIMIFGVQYLLQKRGWASSFAPECRIAKWWKRLG
ncbi:MAG: hypothetical protein HC915_19155 [Anaerolineae bacterium]|nr:hypothetical protein [Anaerolineae bacterium]